MDKASALYEFKPDYLLLSLDAYHLTAGVHSALDKTDVDLLLEDAIARIRKLWRLAKEAFHCPIIHQTALPVHLPVLGQNEHQLPGSRANFVARLNAHLRTMADEENVDLLTVDAQATRDGIDAWHSPALWHRSKQEIAIAAGPLYGDLVARLIAAKKGYSYKCLVLDLDNTIWGGVVGDDGLEGIVIGRGTALGEAFVQFQDYCRELSRRGVILAVCSKNDEANALEPFDSHPDMVLKRNDISCFVANWSDKASNMRAIAEKLNIGLDSLVFVDDNPFETKLSAKNCQWWRRPKSTTILLTSRSPLLLRGISRASTHRRGSPAHSPILRQCKAGCVRGINDRCCLVSARTRLTARVGSFR